MAYNSPNDGKKGIRMQNETLKLVYPQWQGGANVINAINLISQNTQVVGLSVAEHLPKVQIKLKELLSNLPLIKE